MRVIDLFCGAGGFSEGFRQAGFKIVEGYDIWSDATTSFHLNQDSSWVTCDLTKKSPSFFPKTDVVIGSPPCVDFSQQHNKADFRDGMKLVYKFLEIVCHLKPRWWVMENVPQVAKYLPDEMAPTKTILNSASFGVAQIRHRCFIGSFPNPVPTHFANLGLFERPLFRTVRDALDGVSGGECLKVSRRDLSIIEKIGEGERLDWHAERKGFESNYQRDRWDSPARVLTTTPNWHPTENRRYSVEETTRLMGFPDGYRFHGSTTSKLRQLGNAVCPPVSRAVAEAILVKEGQG